MNGAMLDKNPVAFWPLDDGVGTTLRDASGHGNDLKWVDESTIKWLLFPSHSATDPTTADTSVF